jgi:rhodanese-related sulfurtransferase
MKCRAVRKTSLALLLALVPGCGDSEVEGESAMIGAADTLPLSVPAPEVEDGLLIVSPERVFEWQQSDVEFVLIDARDGVQYAREHIPGAINLPYVEIRAGGLLPPRDRRVVVYCSSETCPISQYAYQALDQLGYQEIYDMRAGLQGWKDAGFPTVFGADTTASSR